MRFYLLSIFKDKELYANVYSNKPELKEGINKFEKYPKRVFELHPTEFDHFDLCIAKTPNGYVVALEPKEKIHNPAIIRCYKKELDIKEVLI